MKTKREARRRDKRETARTGIPKEKVDSDIPPIVSSPAVTCKRREDDRRQPELRLLMPVYMVLAAVRLCLTWQFVLTVVRLLRTTK